MIEALTYIVLIWTPFAFACVKIYIKLNERNDKCYKTIKPKFNGLQGFGVEYSRVSQDFNERFVELNKEHGIELIEISIDEFEKARKKAQRKSP